MLTFLILILTVAVTFLVTDFRRWLQIRELEASHEAEIDQTFDSAFDSGYEWGALLTKIVHDPKSNLENLP